MTKLIKSSAGGTIKITPTGLVHTAGDQAYSGYLAEAGLEAKVYDAPKRGRGRPSKVSQSGAPYDFSAFGTVKIPKWTGASCVYAKAAE
jgi:hypothetical protein